MKPHLEQIEESRINLISSETRLEGTFEFPDQTRIYGTVKGVLKMKDGSELFLEESSTVEGEVHAHTLWINGFVSGKVFAKKKIALSSTARVFGELTSPTIEISFGAIFEGSSQTKSPAATSE